MAAPGSFPCQTPFSRFRYRLQQTPNDRNDATSFPIVIDEE
jgi:hypothetical protein